MRKIQFLLLAAIVAAFFIGCGEVVEAPDESITEGTLHSHDDAFATAMVGEASVYYVYTPAGYSATGTAYPVVYLLHGFGGDEDYFVNTFSAIDAANAMIDDGTIDPMVIVMPCGKNPLGGSFYTNSDHAAVATGEDHILGIITEVEATYNVMTTADGKAIGGHSMGGFGAISITMNNGGMFGSVGALSAPLSFWGTRTAPPHDDMTYKGIEELLPAVLLETGYDPATDGAAEYAAKMYPAPDRTVTSMMFAMAAAFSPTVFNAGVPDIQPTTIQALPNGDPMFVDLPLGLDGNIDMTVWMRWLAYDPVSRMSMDAAQFNSLSDAAIFLDCGLEDDLGLHGAQQVFAGALAAAMIPADNDTYYPGAANMFGEIKAGHGDQIYERMKLMLQFFDGQF